MLRVALKVLLVSGILSGMAFSQGSTGRRIMDPNYLVTRTVSEAIISINLKTSEVELKDWDGKVHTVKVNNETKFPKNRPATTLRDLHEGQWMRYTYRVADATVLEILEIRSSAQPRIK